MTLKRTNGSGELTGTKLLEEEYPHLGFLKLETPQILNILIDMMNKQKLLAFPQKNNKNTLLTFEEHVKINIDIIIEVIFHYSLISPILNLKILNSIWTRK